MYYRCESGTNASRVLVGSGDSFYARTFDCTGISGYKGLTADNFALVPTKTYTYPGLDDGYERPTTAGTISNAITYNSSTGTASVARMYWIVTNNYGSGGGAYIDYNLYCYI